VIPMHCVVRQLMVKIVVINADGLVVFDSSIQSSLECSHSLSVFDLGESGFPSISIVGKDVNSMHNRSNG